MTDVHRGPYPDYIVLRAESIGDRPEIGSIDGEWFDRSRMPFLETIARGLFNVVIEPTPQFEISDDGSVAQVWCVREPYSDGS